MLPCGLPSPTSPVLNGNEQQQLPDVVTVTVAGPQQLPDVVTVTVEELQGVVTVTWTDVAFIRTLNYASGNAFCKKLILVPKLM
jgi:hypothetical protein